MDNTYKVFNTAAGYRFLFPEQKVEAVISRIIEDRRTQATTGEVSIRLANKPIYDGNRLNFNAPNSKKSFINALEERDNSQPWMDIVDTIARETLERNRIGEPIEVVGNRPLTTTPAYRLFPLLPEGLVSNLFGEGGSLKSYLAILIGLLVQSGEERLGLAPRQGNVGFFDFETTAQETNDRIVAVSHGLGLEGITLCYRACMVPLEFEGERLHEIVSQNNLDLLIVDSLGMALSDNDPRNSDPTLRLMRILRPLRKTCLLIDHVAKGNGEDRRNAKTPYGNVYKINTSRSAWELRRTGEGDRLSLGLFHRKVNNGPLRKPLGFAFQFVNNTQGVAESVIVFEQDVKEDQELAENLPVKERIRDLLRPQGAIYTTKEMADKLGLTDGVVRVMLSRLGKEVYKLPGREGGWCLVRPDEDA